ncbi:MAG TPA: HNH endonuclease signature motif containing protein, partial [Mycobacteriales bacterium]|nr:HNH endonuclease signature motif containing protein [Mycobacteriales bacterium]
HIRWWRHGGRTDRHNLVLLCSFHHYLVHDRGWTIEMDTSRNVTITSPDGRSWTSRPRGPTQLAL